MEPHPKVRQLLRKVRRWSPIRWQDASVRSTRDPGYEAMMARDVANYRSVESVHDLPGVYHYRSNIWFPGIRSLGCQIPTVFIFNT